MITFAALTWRPVDIILVAVIAAVRKKKGSSCCGDCAKCRSRCPS